MKKAILLIFVCLVVIGGWWVYNRRQANSTMTNGDLTSPDGSVTTAEPISTDATIAPPGTPAKRDLPTLAADLLPKAAPTAAKPPAGDTISPNPPNGMVFSGTGHFQIYRQGNITWRVNTDSGQSCILFATDSEWRKPRVYENGCAKS